jgi:hypothetical protein
MTRLLVTGDRNWDDYQAVEDYLRIAMEQGVTHVIEGEARGADTMARDAGWKLGLTVLRFPAEWDVYGRAAGPVRNQQMLDQDQPDRAVAFHLNLAKSKGTLDMVQRIERAGLPLDVVPFDTRKRNVQTTLEV